jgi:methionyl-tRNA synthetase
MTTTYVTVAIPFVNASPHLGYAFELVEADIFARAWRCRGDDVRFLGGTDDHSLKNVLAAEAAGVSTADHVSANGARFAALRTPLGLSFDDFIHTSSDPRHRPAVEHLWRACLQAGDLYRRDYEGRYCVGCEQFFGADELADGRCPEHDTVVEAVAETNWFFRLSRYTDALIDLIRSGRLAITPAPFREEVLAFLRRGLTDISVSRNVDRARGWGIPVPDDPSQVVYVWFDALTNYLSALRLGDADRRDYDRWWAGADRRVHVIGKGILRFHAVYWPAFLLSAGLALPTEIHVHPYLTVGGVKLSKSAGVTIDPGAIAAAYGTDRLRWWLGREPSATTDTDFTAERLAGCADRDLANGIGNAVSRVAALIHRHRDGVTPETGAAPLEAAAELPATVLERLGRFDRRGATDAIVAAVDALNRDLEATAPWRLAKQPGRAGEVDILLDRYHRSAAQIGAALEPIVPELAAAIAAQLHPRTALPPSAPVIARVA